MTEPRLGGASKWGDKQMRAGRLLLEITVYYLVIGFAIYIAIKIWPDLRNYLPIGGVEQLITQPTKNPLEASEAVRAACLGPPAGRSPRWRCW